MKKVCVQGLGFVGSAMSAAIANARNSNGEYYFDVIGIDLNSNLGNKRVNLVNSGIFPAKTTDQKLKDIFKDCVKRGNLKATHDDKFYSEADVIIVDIALDINFLDDNPKIDFERLKNAIRTISKRMKSDALIIIETTVPPGTCKNIIAPIILEEINKRGILLKKINLAHSYERVMPGKNYYDSIVNFWRVYSGINEQSSSLCFDFLSKIIDTKKYPLTRLDSTTASETAKLLENSYRAANIAFIHEWTVFAEKVGINLFEIINAIQVRPTHKNIRYPGLGIGGYCLTKDPSFTPAASKQIFDLDLEFPFSKLSIKVANQMPIHTFKRVKEILKNLNNKKILLCGASYRQDVADTRYSPTEILYKELLLTKANVEVHDPLVSYWEELSLETKTGDLPDASNYDLIIFCIPHSEYTSLNLSEWIKDKNKTKVLDAFMVFKTEQRKRYISEGLQIEAIGVSKGL